MKSEIEDYIENLEYENKNMAEFLKVIGLTDEQIENLCYSNEIPNLKIEFTNL